MFTGFPASCHADVSKNSPIYKSITTGQVQIASCAVILAEQVRKF